MFSPTDTADTFVVPGDTFSFGFDLAATPTITAGNFTNVSFDVPAVNFTYALNGTVVSVPAPTEITFYTAADGGGFAVAFPSAEFIFGSSQLFTGTTATPTFSTGTFTNQSFIFLDSSNVDGNSATVALASVPEPSSGLLVLGGCIGAFAIGMRKSGRSAGFFHR